MPLARIETRKTWPTDMQQLLINALHAAMVESLKIPANDKQIRYIEHPSDLFAVPPDATERYTLVEISLFVGRSLEAKRNLYRGIVKRFGELGIAPPDVFILLHEEPLENWGIRGGQAAADLDLGFTVNV